MLAAYLKYRIKSGRAKAITHAVIADFKANVIAKAVQNQWLEIEAIRAALKKQKQTIQMTDFGAGSRKNATPVRTIASIAKNAAVPPKFGRLLGQLVAHYKCKEVLELGTSLGIGTAYLAKGAPDVCVTTLEGCPETLAIAQQNFDQLGLKNIAALGGEFSASLKQLESQQKKYDLVYIDGNHRLKPTLNYFQFAMRHTSENAIVVMDDIHWSDEMEEAWKTICANEKVGQSIDLFRMGIILKRKKNQAKAHVAIAY